MHTQPFEKLVIWQQSMNLVARVYRATHPFPSDERSGLAATLRRSAVAIPAKIADGHGCGDHREFQKAVAAALGSMRELHTHITIARRLKYLSAIRTFLLRRQVHHIKHMLDELMAEPAKTSDKETGSPPDQ